MTSLNRTSTFIENQLPEFIRGNPEYTLFVQFLQKYYEYLELPGNPIYELRRAEENYDVDLARKSLLKYFKDKILPSFPEETELSTERIIKASRDFYAKKGTPDSFKFLFRVLYGQEVEVFLPKSNILRASDGKWQIPQAIRISFADESYLVSSNLSTVNVATSNVVNYAGDLYNTPVIVDSYIRIGNEKRKVIDVGNNYITVEVPFANTPASANSGVIYQSNAIYHLVPNQNASFNYDLLVHKLAVGANSKTTCIIEGAYKTYDKDTGQEIAELYVSNVNRDFEAGEFLNIEYQDTNGVTSTFSSKIIASISSVVLLKDRFNRSLGGKRYLIGDPVVFEGGLDKNTDQATKAIAVVKDVTTGGIDIATLNKTGYYFRDYANGGLIQIQSTTGVGANLLIKNIWTDGGYANSNTFAFATDALVFKRDILLNDNDYEFDNVTNYINLTSGSGSTTTTVNLNTATYMASSVNDYYKSFVLTVVGGTGVGATPNSAVILSYNGATKIATLDVALGATVDATSNVKITANANTEIGRALSFDSFTLGKIKYIDLVDGGSSFADPPTFEGISTYETDYSLITGFQYILPGFDNGFYGYDPYAVPYPTIKLGSSNNQFSLANGFYTGTRLFADVGKTAHFVNVVDYVVTNPLTSANVKTLYLDRRFENNINDLNIQNFNLFFDYRANVRGKGQIGTVEIINGGLGYSASDKINFQGIGYNAEASILVNGDGTITDVIMVNRGEGYYGDIVCVVNNSTNGISTGSGANLIAWGLSDGERITATTTDVGRIKTFDILNRGFGYLNTPNVSLKIVDIYSTTTSTLISSGDVCWQGNTTNANATFTGLIDDVYNIPGTSNSIIRVYNYNGNLNNAAPLRVNTTSYGNIVFTLTPKTDTISFKGVYKAIQRTYPYYYGDGLAKARAVFLNGLIKYQGYYINTDGFVSADQRLQDATYYHNFSYEIQSEKSLDDYKSTVYEVIHPAGTQLLSKYLIKDLINDPGIFTSNVYTSNSVGGTISATHANNVLYGTGSAALANTVNVGDTIIINTNASEYRRYVRTITGVSPILIDNPIGNYSDGVMRLTFGSNVANVIGNTYALTDTLYVNDDISFIDANNLTYNLAVANVYHNDIWFTAVSPVSDNVVYHIDDVLTNVSYRLIKGIA